MIRGGFLLMAAGLAGLAASDGLPLLLVSLATAVTGFGCVTPSLSALVSKQADAADQGGMMGLAASASALGRIFGPLVGNTIYAPEGPRGSAFGRAVAPLFGDLDNHRRPYVLGAVLAAALFLAALGFLGKREPRST